MNRISNNLKFSEKLILSVIPLLFNQAYAYSGYCGTLHVLVNNSVYHSFKVYPDSPIVTHGINRGCDAVERETGECTDFVFEQEGYTYGPDIIIVFIDRRNFEQSTIRIQQNFCFWEGGNITVEKLKGEFIYKKYTGTYTGDRPGLVVITSIQTTP